MPSCKCKSYAFFAFFHAFMRCVLFSFFMRAVFIVLYVRIHNKIKNKINKLEVGREQIFCEHARTVWLKRYKIWRDNPLWEGNVGVDCTPTEEGLRRAMVPAAKPKTDWDLSTADPSFVSIVVLALTYFLCHPKVLSRNILLVVAGMGLEPV